MTVGGAEREDEQGHDHDDVVEYRRERGGDEPVPGVEQRAREGREAVEDHLRNEAEDQHGQHVQLSGPVGAVLAQDEQPREYRRQHHRHRGEERERGHRDREDGRRRAFVAAFEQVDEHRYQCRGEDAADQQLVDDVGRDVREVVGVGERGLADRGREHDDPQQPGQP